MANVIALLQGRVMYLEQENNYLKDLLQKWLAFYTIHIKKEKQGKRCQLPVKLTIKQEKTFSLIEGKEES